MQFEAGKRKGVKGRPGTLELCFCCVKEPRTHMLVMGKQHFAPPLYISYLYSY